MRLVSLLVKASLMLFVIAIRAQAASELKGPVQLGAGIGPTWLQSNRGYPGILVHAGVEYYPAAQPYFSMGPSFALPVTAERQRGTLSEGGQTGRYTRVHFTFSGRLHVPSPALWLRFGGGLAHLSGTSENVSSKLAPIVEAGVGYRMKWDERVYFGGELRFSHTSKAEASLFAPSVLSGTIGDSIPQANAISLCAIVDFQL